MVADSPCSTAAANTGLRKVIGSDDGSSANDAVVIAACRCEAAASPKAFRTCSATRCTACSASVSSTSPTVASGMPISRNRRNSTARSTWPCSSNRQPRRTGNPVEPAAP